MDRGRLHSDGLPTTATKGVSLFREGLRRAVVEVALAPGMETTQVNRLGGLRRKPASFRNP